MALTLMYLIFRQQLAWLAVLARDDAAKTAEILPLRHDNALPHPAGEDNIRVLRRDRLGGLIHEYTEAA